MEIVGLTAFSMCILAIPLTFSSTRSYLQEVSRAVCKGFLVGEEQAEPVCCGQAVRAASALWVKEDLTGPGVGTAGIGPEPSLQSLSQHHSDAFLSLWHRLS